MSDRFEIGYSVASADVKVVEECGGLRISVNTASRSGSVSASAILTPAEARVFAEQVFVAIGELEEGA